MTKIRNATLVLNDDFAIENSRAATRLGPGAHDRRIAVAPIKAVSRIGTRHSALDYRQRAVAIMLDFVNPIGASGRLVSRGQELWLDKTKFNDIAGLPGFSRHS